MTVSPLKLEEVTPTMLGTTRKPLVKIVVTQVPCTQEADVASPPRMPPLCPFACRKQGHSPLTSGQAWIGTEGFLQGRAAWGSLGLVACVLEPGSPPPASCVVSLF